MKLIIYKYINIMFGGESWNELLLMLMNSVSKITRYSDVECSISFAGKYINTRSFVVHSVFSGSRCFLSCFKKNRDDEVR